MLRPLVIWPVLWCPVLSGCLGGGPDSDAAPSRRLGTIAEIVRTDDASRVGELIVMLDSDDPAVRLFAARGIEAVLGQDIEYDYAAPEHRREHDVTRLILELDMPSTALPRPGAEPGGNAP